jgi:hypothetical protein
MGKGREAILKSAAKLFAGKGFAGASTREICEGAGLPGENLFLQSSQKRQHKKRAYEADHQCNGLPVAQVDGVPESKSPFHKYRRIIPVDIKHAEHPSGVVREAICERGVARGALQARSALAVAEREIKYAAKHTDPQAEGENRHDREERRGPAKPDADRAD